MPKKRARRPEEGSRAPAPSGFLQGLTDLVEKLGELADSGRQWAASGELGGASDKDLKGVYGINVRVGLGGQPVRVEPFGNLKMDARSGAAVVREVREPLVDVLEEADHLLVVAEMPGVSAEDVKIDLDHDLLTIMAGRGDKKYRKEVLLPRACPQAAMKVSCNNGIVEIKCPYR